MLTISEKRGLTRFFRQFEKNVSVPAFQKRALTRFFRQFEKNVSVPAFRGPTFIVYGGAKASGQTLRGKLEGMQE